MAPAVDLTDHGQQGLGILATQLLDGEHARGVEQIAIPGPDSLDPHEIDLQGDLEKLGLGERYPAGQIAPALRGPGPAQERLGGPYSGSAELSRLQRLDALDGIDSSHV